jgi:hypothetical protein
MDDLVEGAPDLRFNGVNRQIRAIAHHGHHAIHHILRGIRM